jgi:hypothetical protein
MLGVLLINPTFGGASGSGQHVKQLYEALSGRVNFEIWDATRVGFLNLPMLRSASLLLQMPHEGSPEWRGCDAHTST